MKKTQTFLGSLYPWAFLGLSKKLPQFNSGFMLWESQHQEYSKQDWKCCVGLSPALGQEDGSRSVTNDGTEEAICQPLWRVPRAYARCSMQTSLIVPGRSTMLCLHVFNSGEQEIVAWGFSGAAAAVWGYYIDTFHGSSLLQLCRSSVLATRAEQCGDTRDGSSAAAALFFRLVSKLFAFSVLLLPVFAPEPEWIQVSFLPAWARFPCTQPLAFLWANLTETPALDFLLCPCFLP